MGATVAAMTITIAGTIAAGVAGIAAGTTITATGGAVGAITTIITIMAVAVMTGIEPYPIRSRSGASAAPGAGPIR